jgi:hypothetical protein
LKLTLHGKTGIQPVDSKYYCVFNSVKAHGIPVGVVSEKVPKFYISLLELAGKRKISSLEFNSKPFELVARETLKKNINLINSAIAAGRFKDAAKIIASRDSDDGLRSQPYLEGFMRSASVQGVSFERDIMSYYMNEIFNRGNEFTEYEALKFGNFHF